jgi:hypothetical protein
MPERQDGWLTAQQAAVEMNTTRAEICPLLSLGRLSGHKRKQSGRPGKSQWLINPKLSWKRDVAPQSALTLQQNIPGNPLSRHQRVP